MQKKKGNTQTGLEIAVIGMAGRFPGANNIEGYWENLKNGVESVTFYNDEELEESGITEELINSQNYVKSNGGVLEDSEFFDSIFFEFTPREAEVMDPQLRLFHECTWAALEDACYDPYCYDGLIGLYAGAAHNFSWQALMALSGKYDILNLEHQLLLNKDFLCSRVSYKLNLKGPAFTVQSACSTSLVAIHQACRALLTKECDIALAGGVSVGASGRSGYLYQENMIKSPDGHCRAFSEKSLGSIGGHGIGVVVLKKLKDALADRDNIYAIIKGSAVNNDGRNKVGYTAPGVSGQTNVIKTALHTSQVNPESIGYVEAHGTGTILGDPIEIRALKEAFNSDKRNFCAIGSVKTNIGHLDAAAGVAGFIKTVLILKNKMIPPSLHSDKANRECDFENTPFYVIDELTKWTSNSNPLRAGTSSFGIGGTNAHVILEEAPEITGDDFSPPSREYKLLLLSGKTKSALDRITENLGRHLEKKKDMDLADVAYSLQIGRHPLRHKKMLVCSKTAEVISKFAYPGKSDANYGSRKVKTCSSRGEKGFVVFMFPGLSSQYIGMGRELYEKELVFRKEMDRCFKIVEPLLGFDLKEILYPEISNPAAPIDQPLISHAVVFIFSYALAKLLMNWGIKPGAMIGYSQGEYVAACVSGVFSLEDALEAIVYRSRLIEKTAPGAMLSVPVPAVDLNLLIEGFKRDSASRNEGVSRVSLISLAVDNGDSCIAAGPAEEIAVFERYLKEKRYICMRVRTFRALHSAMMAPAGEEFFKKIRKISLNKPQIPYISNVTGYWLTAEDALDPQYWSRHLKGTVRFADGIKELVKESNAVFIEVGPGNELSALISRFIEKDAGQRTLSLLKTANKDVSDEYYLLNKLGELWLYDVDIDWVSFYAGQKRRRLSLPTYPFEGQKYMAEQNISGSFAGRKNHDAILKKTNIADWLYIPSWKRIRPVIPGIYKTSLRLCWLLFIDACGLGRELKRKLEIAGQEVIVVKPGLTFSENDKNDFCVNPAEESDYNSLFGKLQLLQKIPQRIVHLWHVTGKDADRAKLKIETVSGQIACGYYSLLNIVKATGSKGISEKIQINVLANNMLELGIAGEEAVSPGKAAVLGPILTIPLEFPNIECRCIDVDFPRSYNKRENDGEEFINRLYHELISEPDEAIIAYRGRSRWARIFEPVPMPEPGELPSLLKNRGVYIITGGLGGIGLHLARYLAKQAQAGLVLVGRTGLPGREKWRELSEHREAGDKIGEKICIIRELEKLGSEVLVFKADAADEKQMREVVAHTIKKFGHINGVIHAAGIADGAIIQRRDPEMCERIFSAKIKGTLVLDEILKDKELDFFINCSALGALFGAVGQTGYCAANSFLDAFVKSKSLTDDRLYISINWDRWKNVGIAVIAEEMHKKLTGGDLAGGISTKDCLNIFGRILNERLPQVVISPYDLGALAKYNKKSQPSLLERKSEAIIPSRALSPKPELYTEYTAPRNDNEKKLTTIWQNLFGYEQIGVRDDFFELGGDSLKAITAISIINKELGVNIAIAEFFNNATIEKINELIRNRTKVIYIPVKNVEKKEYYGVSSAQRRLYILQQIEAESTNYNEAHAMPLRKDMEVERFEDIFKKIVSRHEGLRTSFKMVHEEPVQVLHDKVEFKIVKYKKGDTGIEKIKRNFSRPFDLAKAPLFRMAIIENDSKNAVLLFDLHHIIFDAVSQNILTEEFMALYLAKELPALRIQYKDYAAWRKNQEQLDLIKSRQAYWVNVFSGELPVLNLPFDYVRPVVQSKAGAMVSFALSKEKSRLIKKIAAKNNVTLYMVLLALLNVLLSKLSGDEDIIIGTPVSARQFPELDRIIGIFLNTLSMRNFPKGERTFDDFLRDVKTRTLAAYENQDYQFEDLVAGLSLVRDTGRNPIFDVMFNLMKQEEFEGDLSLLETDTFKHIKSSSKFDLNFKVVEMGEVIFFQLGYCTGLFKPETIDRIILCFKRVILELSKKPDLRLAEVEIMSQEEKNRILTQFNDTAGDYPQNRNVHGLFEDRVTRTPECIALTFEDKKLTYKELNARAEALAKYLIAKGVGRGMIVGMLQNRSAEIMIALYGILKTGGAYLPLDPDHPVKRLQYILKESSAEIVLTDNASYKSPEIEFIDIGDKAICGHRGIEPVSSPSSEDAAYVTYTSGSTGNPKGVVIEHRNIVNFIEAINRTISFSAGDRVLSLTTVSFDIFGLETLHPLTKGAMVIIGNREEQIDSRLFSRIMNREQVTVFQVTPSRLKYLLSDHKTTVSLGLLKNLLIGGEELPVGLLEKVKGVKAGKIYNLYGPTETTIWSSIKEISRDEFVSIGRPVLNTRISILNKSLGLEPIGAAGEIYIGGEGLAAGYLNNSELTGERFINDPYRSGSKLYRTGDLGRWMPDGNIECLGRVDFQVKIRGYRIEPGEIENHLMELPFIEEALVVDRLGADGERYLCSYIVMNHDKKEASIEREDGAAKAGNDAGNINNKIRRYLSNHLPGYMIPSYFVILENIPLTPNGKIDRKKLPEPEVGTGRDYEAPRNEIEEKLIEIWSEVLNVKKEAIGLDTNFFEIGGNSLKILNVERQIRDKLHKEISIIDLFIHSTIRLIGDYLKKGKQELIVIDEDRKAIVKKGKNKLKEKRKKREAGKIV